jgi:hypothetical protein
MKRQKQAQIISKQYFLQNFSEKQTTIMREFFNFNLKSFSGFPHYNFARRIEGFSTGFPTIVLKMLQMNSSRVVRMKRVERKLGKNVTKEEYLMMKITYSVDGKLQSNCHHKFGNKLTHDGFHA